MKWTFCLLLVALFNCPDTAQAFDPAPDQLIVGTWNVEWMFDHDKADNRSDLAREQSAPSEAYWQGKLTAVAAAIAEAAPTIMALQEIEGEQTLAAIATELRQRHKRFYRYAFIPGSDSFTEQDVGILYQGGMQRYSRYEQTREMFDSERFYNLSKQLFAEFRWGQDAQPLVLLTTHLRAREEAEDVRNRQARLARYWLGDSLRANQDVILLGDLNTEQPAGERTGTMLTLLGQADEVPLVDLLERIPEAQGRRTHLILDRQYDRILVSPSLVEDGPGQDWVFQSIRVRPELNVRGRADGQEHWDNRLTMDWDELDVSDHHPLFATFQLK